MKKEVFYSSEELLERMKQNGNILKPVDEINPIVEAKMGDFDSEQVKKTAKSEQDLSSFVINA